ncbi:TrkH family potassium uptake protein [Virgibacillus sp. MG-45]|uniref:TrkH family potassium uptake protein n=1 Tax=Virgibacillus sp. MG-45 TaxID=3102791 RepID=UPI002ED813B7
MRIYHERLKLQPPQFLLLIIIGLILVGSILLKLPIASHTHLSWIDAIFTSTSAVTVTGLAVVDTGSSFTMFGQLVILLLIQLGGLGIMSFAVLLFMLLGKRLGIKQRLIVGQALNHSKFGGIIGLVKKLLLYSLIIEFVGVIILAFRWVPEFGFGHGLYVSIFHAISAFNNAGFSIWSDSLAGYAADPVINLMISLLIIAGGLGFTVLADVWQKRSFRAFTLHTKVMIVGTIVVNVLAMIVIFLLEYGNTATIGTSPIGEKLLASYFQAITPRTAGFNTINIGELHESTILVMLVLMFIGGGSTSTAGGIKLTTFIIIALTVSSFLRGRKEVEIQERRIEMNLVIKALAILTISFAFIFCAIFLLSLTEEKPLLQIAFEAVSAFGTVGLSMGITGDLSDLGKGLIAFMMFIGKLGPLTLMFSLARSKESHVRYPSEDLFVG